MKQSENIRKELMHDLKEAITYTPNRQIDIWRMLNNYQSNGIDSTEKEKILNNLANCIQGKEYDEPDWSIRSGYTMETVEQLECLFDDFKSKMKTAEQADLKILKNNFIDAVYKLDADASGLLDTWRREQLYEWADAVQNENSLQCDTNEPEETEGLQFR